MNALVQMMLVGCLPGVNMTYFVVCLHTAPAALLACMGWVEVIVMR